MANFIFGLHETPPPPSPRSTESKRLISTSLPLFIEEVNKIGCKNLRGLVCESLLNPLALSPSPPSAVFF